MVRFTAADYADMVVVYGVAGGKGAEAARIYAEQFPNRVVPDPRTFRDAFQRLREGNVLPRHGEGRPRRADGVHLEEAILQSVEESPELSVRGITSSLRTARSTVHRVMRVEGLHPWKFTPVQELKPEYLPKCVDFCQWLLDRSRDPEFIRNVCWTDEKLSVRKGIINQHNEHHWAFVNPGLAKETNFQYRWDSMNIWGGIIGDEVHIYHLPGRLDGGNYLGFLQDRLVTVIGDGPAERAHDGAPAHTCVAVVDQLNEWFPDRWIGNRSDRDRGGHRQPPVAWPPRSPDLTPLDFFLWGTLESRIYAHHPANQEEMVALLHAAVATITPEELERMRRNLLKRARLCIDAGGGLVENLL
ncbi:uncharacterized protein LOC107046734 [Diachasma alloeum]|uniref:uncharacterized protein LOC107046734 n=1 Tax=Diachasma alloeum TaxID=454923 RepID=UPI0007380FD5|nr:uncharacterized protein LOC107046734 [Diachasma alloeum]